MDSEAGFEPQIGQLKETSPEIKEEATLTKDEKIKKLETYRKAMIGLVKRICHNPADKDIAEDLVQNAYLNAWRGLDTFAHESSLKTWLSRITTNEALQQLRKRKTITKHFDPDANIYENSSGEIISKEAMDPNWDFVKQLINKEGRSVLNKILAKMPEMYRQIIILTVLGDLNITEAAAKLGIKKDTAKTRRTRALNMIYEKAKLIKP